MISTKRKIAVGILLAFALVFSACKKEDETKVIRLGHGLDVTHPVHKAMKFMADRIEEKSKGQLTVAIYPSQQLGTERELVELLQIGSLGMTKVSTGVVENFAPELKIFGLPFLFEGREHRFKVLESEIGEKLLEASVRNRLKGLTFYDAGSRSFYSTQPLNSPEDLKGQKIRVMESQTAINMVKYLGGSPTPVSWGELYTALQQGIVDGAENNLPSFYLSYHYEVCKYYMVDEHTALPDELLISTVVWDKLSKQEQKWVKDAAMESSEYEKKIWREAELHALKEIKKAGVKVTYPDKEQFRGMVQPMYDEFEKDPEMKKTIRAIQALK